MIHNQNWTILVQLYTGPINLDTPHLEKENPKPTFGLRLAQTLFGSTQEESNTNLICWCNADFTSLPTNCQLPFLSWPSHLCFNSLAENVDTTSLQSDRLDILDCLRTASGMHWKSFNQPVIPLTPPASSLKWAKWHHWKDIMHTRRISKNKNEGRYIGA